MSLTCNQVEEQLRIYDGLIGHFPAFGLEATDNLATIMNAARLAVSILPDENGEWDKDTVEVIAMAIAMNPLQPRMGSVTDMAKAILAALNVEPIDS